MFFRSENKDYYLEAPDRAVMMFWLQELQKRRRSHATQRNSDFLPYKVWIDIYKLYYSSLAYIWNQIFNITTKILSSGGLVKITFPLESDRNTSLQPISMHEFWWDSYMSPFVDRKSIDISHHSVLGIVYLLHV